MTEPSQTASGSKVTQACIEQIQQLREAQLPHAELETLTRLAVRSADHNNVIEPRIASRLELVQCLKDQGKINDAVTVLREIEELNAKHDILDHTVLLDIADLSLIDGNSAEAIIYYQKILDNNCYLPGDIADDYRIIASLGLVSANLSNASATNAIDLLYSIWNDISQISTADSDVAIDKLVHIGLQLSKLGLHEMETHCLIKARSLCTEQTMAIEINRLLPKAFELHGDTLKAIETELYCQEELQDTNNPYSLSVRNDTYINRLRLCTLLGDETSLVELVDVITKAKDEFEGLTYTLASYQLVLIDRLIAFGRYNKAAMLLDEVASFIESTIPENISISPKCESILSALKNMDYLSEDAFAEALRETSDSTSSKYPPALYKIIDPQVRKWALQILAQYSEYHALNIKLKSAKGSVLSELEVGKFTKLQRLQYGEEVPLEARLIMLKQDARVDGSSFREILIKEYHDTAQHLTTKRVTLCLEIAESFYDSHTTQVRSSKDTKPTELLDQAVNYFYEGLELLKNNPSLANHIDFFTVYAGYGNLATLIYLDSDNYSSLCTHATTLLIEAYKIYKDRNTNHPSLMHLCSSICGLYDSQQKNEYGNEHFSRSENIRVSLNRINGGYIF